MHRAWNVPVNPTRKRSSRIIRERGKRSRSFRTQYPCPASGKLQFSSVLFRDYIKFRNRCLVIVAALGITLTQLNLVAR